MKRATLFTTLVLGLFVFAGAVSADETVKGNTSSRKVVEFMDNYYDTYNKYGQDAESIDMMDEYWAPEFMVVVYFPLPEYPTMDLFTWKHFLVGAHTHAIETIHCEELSVDTENKTAVSRIVIEFHDRSTDALLLKTDGIGFYNFKVDKKNRLKMTRLRLYFADPALMMQLSAPAPVN